MKHRFIAKELIDTFVFYDDGDISKAYLQFRSRSFIILTPLPNTDEIDIKFKYLDENRIERLREKRHSEKVGVISQIINKKLIFFWIMKNSQGYTDAFQIELGGHKPSDDFVIQFKVISSHIYIYACNEMSVTPSQKKGIK